MPQHLFCFPYSVTHNLCHSIPCPPFCPLSLCHSVTLIPILHPPSPSHHFFPYLCLLTPCLSIPFYSYFPNICSLPLASPFQHLSTLHSVPCDSVSHFLHSPYYPVCHTTPSLVVYKSFQLVVYSLACNCCPLLLTQSPPSLPLVSYHSPPLDNTIPLCLPCLSPPKLRTPLFLSEGATHKLKSSPYPYAAIFHNSYTALCASHSTPSTFPLHLPDSGVALTSSLFHSIPYSIPTFIPSLPQHSTSHSYYS